MRDYCAGRCKPRTIDNYARCIKNIVKPRLGSRKLIDLRPADFAKLHADLRDTPYAANRTLALLRAMFNCAERWEMMPRGANPASVIRHYSERRRDRFLSEEEMERLFSILETLEADGSVTPHEAAAVRLLIYTGCRLGEILTLEWSSVDLQNARIIFEKHKTDKHGAKAIPLNGPAFKLLSELPRDPDHPYVIAGNVPGKHLINLQKPWRRIRKAAGLDDVRIHDLRHSFASFAVSAGVPLALIGGLLGHRSVQTTARYAHIANAPLVEATRLVGDVISRTSAPMRPRTTSAAPSEQRAPATMAKEFVI